MNTLLRRLAEWKAGHRGAQVIVFDGAAEVERTGSFVRGTIFGAALALGAFLLTAPTTTDIRTMEELQHRQLLIEEANGRLRQALEVAEVCLTTAGHLERTLTSYQALLGGAE